MTMVGTPPAASGERQSLIEFIRFNQNAFFAVAYGLTDEQARSTPSVSTLSIGGLIKHAANVQKGWAERAQCAPEFPPKDDRPMEELMAEYADEFVMRRRRNPRSAARQAETAERRDAASLRRSRSRYAGAGAARRAMVPEGHRPLVGALGRTAHHRGADAPRRARRHHSRIRRRRNDVRADGRRRGVAGDRLDQALETGCGHMTPQAHGKPAHVRRHEEIQRRRYVASLRGCRRFHPSGRRCGDPSP